MENSGDRTKSCIKQKTFFTQQCSRVQHTKGESSLSVKGIERGVAQFA